MSTFVLKREYALQLPNNYVEIDRDEMEYVDGGGVPIALAAPALDIVVSLAIGRIAGGISKFCWNKVKEYGTYRAKLWFKGAMYNWFTAKMVLAGLAGSVSAIAGTVFEYLLAVSNVSVGNIICNIWNRYDSDPTNSSLDGF